MVTPIPAQRCIEAAAMDNTQPDVPEEMADKIMGAVMAGNSLGLRTNASGHGATAEGPNFREVALTEFTDPESGDLRYALEMWKGAHKRTYDFTNKARAYEEYEAAAERFNL